MYYRFRRNGPFEIANESDKHYYYGGQSTPLWCQPYREGAPQDLRYYFRSPASGRPLALVGNREDCSWYMPDARGVICGNVTFEHDGTEYRYYCYSWTFALEGQEESGYPENNDLFVQGGRIWEEFKVGIQINEDGFVAPPLGQSLAAASSVTPPKSPPLPPVLTSPISCEQCLGLDAATGECSALGRIGTILQRVLKVWDCGVDVRCVHRNDEPRCAGNHGFYDFRMRQVSVCHTGPARHPQQRVLCRAWRNHATHELWHALQYCHHPRRPEGRTLTGLRLEGEVLFRVPPKKGETEAPTVVGSVRCKDCLCREIQAHANSGDYDKGSKEGKRGILWQAFRTCRDPECALYVEEHGGGDKGLMALRSFTESLYDECKVAIVRVPKKKAQELKKWP